MVYLGLLDGQELVEGCERYLWMSERCLRGIAWCGEKGLDYAIVPRNWETDREIRDCVGYLDGVKQVVLEYAVGILNEYHHADYSVEQWNIMLSAWLDCYLASYYDKYLKLKQIERMGISCECDLYDADSTAPVLDYTDYVTLLSETDAYHVYQYSRLYAAMKPLEHISARRIELYHRPAVRMSTETLPRNAKLYRLVTNVLKLTGKQDDLTIQSSYLPARFLMRTMLKRPGRITNYTCNYFIEERTRLQLETDTAWREEGGALLKAPDDFTRIMCAFLKRDLPTAYVENFAALHAYAKKRYPWARRPKAVLYAATGVVGDEVFKAYLMQVKPAGALLCDVQHGGGYGEEIVQHLYSEYRMCDVFYTWGWIGSPSASCEWRPMPAAKLIGHVFPNRDDGDILYTGYCGAKNVFRHFLHEFNMDKSLGGEERFLRQLSPDIKKRLRFRAYHSDYGWGYYQRIRRTIPELQFDPIPDYYDSLGKAKLVVSSEWETTICEALAAGRAVLMRREPMCIEENAAEDIEEMHRVGILAYSFEELAEMLDRAVPDIDAWWNEPERQAVVRRIRDKYAYLPPNAEEIWEKELLRLADL